VNNIEPNRCKFPSKSGLFFLQNSRELFYSLLIKVFATKTTNQYSKLIQVLHNFVFSKKIKKFEKQIIVIEIIA
jgi:hypothetical protein